jgi:hypothetical protein
MTQPQSYSSQFYNTLVSSLSDPAFINRHRNQPVDFTRNTLFTFPRVVGILLTTLQRSLQAELDQFFAQWPLPDGRLAHDDAFRMARKKLKPSVFVDLNSVCWTGACRDQPLARLAGAGSGFHDAVFAHHSSGYDRGDALQPLPRWRRGYLFAGPRGRFAGCGHRLVSARRSGVG